MPEPEQSIDATIQAAVNARVEAEVMRALSGDEVVGRYVAAALSQKVEVKRADYRTEKVSFLTVTLEKAIQAATQDAVQTIIEEELPTIEAEVRKALRRNVVGIAEALTQSLADAADKTYGVKVDMTLRMPSRD